MTPRLRQLCFPLALCAISPAAMAQLIEDVELRKEGNNAVASVRFVTGIQFLRVINSASGDVGQAFYQVLPTRTSLSLISSQRRIEASGRLPEITVVDEAEGRAELSRKIIVRLGTPTPYRIRAGRGNRSIDIVFPGLAEAVPAAPAAKAPARVPTQFSITLQSSTEPGFFLQGSVPAKLQSVPIFTSERQVDGQTVRDIGMGPFATRAEAESALALLQPRFPQARLVEPSADLPAQAASGDTEARAAGWMAQARQAVAAGNTNAAIDALIEVLNLPPNTASREAQAMLAEQRLKAGDNRRAKAEMDAFLALYPAGPDSDRIRTLRAGLPDVDPPQARPVRPTETYWSGSVSGFYYGGQSKERNDEFQNSPISGLPELIGANTLSSTDQGQFQTNVDLNWRQRSAESDSRFVYRDAYTANFQEGRPNRRRLSALYYDQKSFTQGTQFRVGRQSPTGGGMLYRFDGATAGYTFAPKWRINVAAGAPTDDLLQTSRRVMGAWVDADALTSELGGTFYVNRQTIDGVVDRQAIGTELRYFSGGLSMFSQLDYDTAIGGVNIVSLQGTWQGQDNTVVNFLFDQRNAPLLSLGNILFFQDPTQPTLAQRVSELLGTSSITQLREQVKAITAQQTQALLGVTTPLSDKWQVGGDIRFTRVGALPAVPSLGLAAQPSTGNLWGLGAQLIGSNLYSERDTHVLLSTLLTGPTYRGVLLSYNNLTSLSETWRLEPSLRLYRQIDTNGTRTVRWTPGFRVSYKLRPQATLESEVTFERTRRNGPSLNERSDRMFYFVGARYDF